MSKAIGGKQELLWTLLFQNSSKKDILSNVTIDTSMAPARLLAASRSYCGMSRDFRL